MSDLVSVIIPTYNRAHCLRQAVDSALGQTHRALEVVIVDDGSADGTPELVERLYGGEPRVRYARQANAGVSAARNRALSLAGGDFVAFLDSDDVWAPWKVALQLAAFRAAPEVGMVWSDMEAVGPDGRVVNPRHLRTMYTAYRHFRTEELFDRAVTLDGPWADGVETVAVRVGTIYPQIVMGNLVHTSTAMLARGRLAAVGGFDEAMRDGGEDYDFHLRTCRVGPVAFLDVATIRYQIGMPDQLTARPYGLAANFLRVLDRTAAGSARPALPPARLREAFRGAHAWAGDEAAAAGMLATARRHWLQSLSYKPWQPRVCGHLALSLLPGGVEHAARTLWRRVRPARRGAPWQPS